MLRDTCESTGTLWVMVYSLPRLSPVEYKKIVADPAGTDHREVASGPT